MSQIRGGTERINLVKEEEEEAILELEYEKFCDTYAIAFSQGAFAVTLGQGIYEPTKLFVRIWIDTITAKKFLGHLKERIEDYEKTYGKITIKKE